MAATNTFETTGDDQQCKAHLMAIGDALYAIGGKWKLRIIIALMHGKSRFNELQRMIEGISSKVLAADLKELEMNGFIERNVHAETPVVVEYELTDYATSLKPILQALAEWGALHRRKIRQSMKQDFESRK